jgi:hypothetical protein
MSALDPLKGFEHYARGMNAPRIGESAAQLADRDFRDLRPGPLVLRYQQHYLINCGLFFPFRVV